jgi:hypothetical protein
MHLTPALFWIRLSLRFFANLDRLIINIYIGPTTCSYHFLIHMPVDFDMNAEESVFTYIIDRVTSSSIFEIPDENEERHSGKCYTRNSPKTPQCIITPRHAREFYSLQRPIGVSLVHQALQIFLSDTVILTPGVTTSKGHFANLITLVKSSVSKALPLALESVALASLANRLGNPNLQIEATRRYTASIQQLRKVDLNLSSNVLNLIACIVFLGLFEVRQNNRSN